MRKVYEKAIRLLLADAPMKGKPGKNDRVTVICKPRLGDFEPPNNERIWLYHENMIAKVTNDGVFVNWCGYFTSSTTARIRALACSIGSKIPNKYSGWVRLTA